jgi:PAS domain S-box-containing protein
MVFLTQRCMRLTDFFWRSLKTRVTLFTLVIFLISIWSLSLYASRMLRQDMQQLLGAQQFSTVSLIASDVNANLDQRLRALELIATRLGPRLQAKAGRYQPLMKEFPLLASLFNGGVFTTPSEGGVTDSGQSLLTQLGATELDLGFIAAAARDGKATMARPVMGKAQQAPVLAMAVPVRDGQGLVVGVLVGLINLGQSNFIDKITGNRYGSTGGYSLVAPQHRLLVTSGDKKRVMTTLPGPDVNPVIDRAVRGEDFSDVYVSSVGVERLTSVKGIPVAGWFVVASVSTDEAFAPIHSMQQRMLLATLLLTLLAGGLTWWMLRSQLAPLSAAAQVLAKRAQADQPMHALPISRPDEIGELLGGFNTLLATLAQRENALKESQFLWRFAIEGSGDGVWDWNIQTNETTYDRQCKEMLGYAQDHVLPVGQEWRVHIHPADLPGVGTAMQVYLAGKSKAFSAEYRLRCRDGNYKWIHSRGMLVSRDGDGAPLRMIGTNSDISDRQEMQAQMRSSLQQVEEKERAKTRFLAAAGHDLRQPVAAASLFLEALKLSAPTARQNELIGLLDQSMAIFSSQLARLLDISKFDAGLIKPELVPVNLAAEFDALRHQFTQTALNRELRFCLFVPKDRALMVLADRALLQSVLLNLVSNAIKFTHAGGILVSARSRGDQVLVQVWDTGIGIAEADLAYIFDEFYQVGNPQRSRDAGLGLGLSICQRAMDLLGAAIICRSTPGGGSVFGFTLPRHHAEAGVTTQALQCVVTEVTDGGWLRDKRMVVVEDDALVASGLRNLLQDLGVDCRFFSNAEDALSDEWVGQADFIIADYALGGERSGLDFLHAVQARRSSRIRAVIITGETSSAFIRHAASSPWPVLHKPISYTKLAASLRA